MSFFKTALLSCWLLCNSILYAQPTYTQYVNPFIGTGGHGHTFPGAVMPFGMVQLSPDTRVDDSWDGCSGYHYSDSIIYGFSHTHLSGTGCSDWGDILLMPGYDFPNLNNKNYSSTFLHKNENANAGYYKVLLNHFFFSQYQESYEKIKTTLSHLSVNTETYHNFSPSTISSLYDCDSELHKNHRI